MAGKFLHLEPGEKHDLSQYFAGPWSEIERRIVSPGTPETLDQGGRELATYVIAGKGVLDVNGTQFQLEPGSAAMLLKDSIVNFHAHETMELLLVGVLTPIP
jgi:hypothetical protein